jgi:hypothetical protein
VRSALLLLLKFAQVSCRAFREPKPLVRDRYHHPGPNLLSAFEGEGEQIHLGHQLIWKLSSIFSSLRQTKALA